MVDEKNDKVKFDIIAKTTKKYISVLYGGKRLVDSYRFLSSSLDSLVKTSVDNSHIKLKSLKEEFVDNGEKLNTVDKIEEEDRTIKDIIGDYPEKIEKLEEATLIYMGENDLKFLETGFPDKSEYLTENLAYPYE